TLENSGIGAQPMLLRAIYNEINFHQPVPPGSSQVDITVFDATKDAKSIAVISRIVFFQPNDQTLTVGEEYAVQNNSQPPRAYYLPTGNFEFTLPADAKLNQIAAPGSRRWSPAHAP